MAPAFSLHLPPQLLLYTSLPAATHQRISDSSCAAPALWAPMLPVPTFTLLQHQPSCNAAGLGGHSHVESAGSACWASHPHPATTHTGCPPAFIFSMGSCSVPGTPVHHLEQQDPGPTLGIGKSPTTSLVLRCSKNCINTPWLRKKYLPGSGNTGGSKHCTKLASLTMR